MNRYFTLALIMLAGICTRAQKMHTMTLASETLAPSLKLNFRVAKVIDGRRDRSSIGLVQRGLANKLRFATFKSPLDQEIMGIDFALERRCPRP